MDQRAARRTAAELFEFDDHLKYVKPWSPDNYAAPFTLLRIDKYDNIWRVEEASGLIVKFDPDTVKMVRGRKRGERLTRGAVSGAMKRTVSYRVGTPGTFTRETDVTWEFSQDRNIAPGHDPERRHLVGLCVGTHGSGPDQFPTSHGITPGRPPCRLHTSGSEQYLHRGDGSTGKIHKFDMGWKAAWACRDQFQSWPEHLPDPGDSL